MEQLLIEAKIEEIKKLEEARDLLFAANAMDLVQEVNNRINQTHRKIEELKKQETSWRELTQGV